MASVGNEFHRLAPWYTNESIPCLIVFTWDWKSNGPLHVSYGLLFNINNMFMNFGLSSRIHLNTSISILLNCLDARLQTWVIWSEKFISKSRKTPSNLTQGFNGMSISLTHRIYYLYQVDYLKSWTGIWLDLTSSHWHQTIELRLWRWSLGYTSGLL